jgi:hypothetical protein
MIKNKHGKKSRFLKELENSPLVEMACRKLNVSRATFYRWCEQDYSFKVDVEIAQGKGRDKLCDFTESKLIENIRDNLQSAIVFCLKHNSKIYRHQYAKSYIEENEQLKKEVRIQKGLIDELIDIMGMDNALRLCSEVDLKTFKEKISKEQRDMPDYR